MTTPTLTRTAFTTGRLLAYFTEIELQLQVGSPPPAWPMALIKELIDNSLDACETASIAPEIAVVVDATGVRVCDNGPGLPREILLRSLDYLVRVSDKAHYVSPSRGQLGNALKCLWAIPYVMSGGQRGQVLIDTQGQRYQVDVSLDQIAQQPQLTVEPQGDASVKSGTSVTVVWPERASYLWRGWGVDFYHPRALLQGYALFNPHATLAYQAPPRGSATHTTWDARDPTWSKWVPHKPTSPHWYSPER